MLFYMTESLTSAYKCSFKYNANYLRKMDGPQSSRGNFNSIARKVIARQLKREYNSSSDNYTLNN